MPYRRLFVFVEGADDLRFFDHVMRPRLDAEFDDVQAIEYARLRLEKINAFVSSILQIPEAAYIIWADFDEATCITARRSKIAKTFSAVTEDRTIVVREEIESWYLAGLSKDQFKDLKIKYHARTDNITKEIFDAQVVPSGASRIERLIQILEMYDLDVGRGRNHTLDYFADKFI